MQKLLKLSLASVIAPHLLAVNANAQIVQVNTLGSFSIFLELGLGAQAAITSDGLGTRWAHLEHQG